MNFQCSAFLQVIAFLELIQIITWHKNPVSRCNQFLANFSIFIGPSTDLGSEVPSYHLEKMKIQSFTQKNDIWIDLL